MLTFSCRMRALAALLVVILSSALAQGPSQQKVTSCQSPGTTCMTCTPRYISSDNDCGWCGNVTVGSTNGKCVSQADYKVNPQQCLPSLPPGEGYRTGPPDSACLPLTDLLALIRTIRIIIGVVVGVAILNAICMGIYVKKKRQGTVIQVVGWTALGLFFPLLSWCFMFCCGPTPPASQTPAVMMVGYGQGSAPPPGESVLQAPPPFNPAYVSQQQQQMYYPQQYAAQPQPYPYGQPAPYAQQPPSYAYPPPQAGTSYQTGAV